MESPYSSQTKTMTSNTCNHENLDLQVSKLGGKMDPKKGSLKKKKNADMLVFYNQT